MQLNAEYWILIIASFIILALIGTMVISKRFLSHAQWRKVKESVVAYLYLLPSFIVLGIFTFFPIVYSFILSFFKWDFQNQKNPTFIWFNNYTKLFELKNPISLSFNDIFFNTILLFVTVICIMHLIFDFKRFTDKKFRNITFSLAIAGTLGIILYNILPSLAVGIISCIILFVYVYLFAIKCIESQHDKLWGRMFLLVSLYAAGTLFFHVPEIFSFLNSAKEQSDFIKAIWNTCYYVVLSTPITIFLALIIAILLNQNLKGKTIFRTIYFIPFVTSVVAISLVWQWIFNDNGLLNYFLTSVGLPKMLWLKDEKLTIPTISIISIWKEVGYYSVIFLSGLQNIDRSYYEAAEVDGANGWHKFKFITWPLLSPTTFFILIVSIIGAFKVFSEVFVLYSGLPGPYNNSGLTVVYYIYEKFYSEQRMGEASAAAYVLFGIILIFSFVQFAAGKKKVNYDN